MKFAVLVTAFTVAAAIRVPASWDDAKTKEVSKFSHRNKGIHRGHDNYHYKIPHQHLPPKRFYGKPPRFVNNRKPVQKPFKSNIHNFKSNGWTPIVPPPHYYNGDTKGYKKKPYIYEKPHKKKNYDDNSESMFQKNNYKEEEEPFQKVADFEDGDYLENAKLRQSTKENFIKHELNKKSQPELEYSNDEDDESDEDVEETSESFVPTKFYAKVRRNDNYEHLPYDENDRLKKVVKESKIHTIYTEKGFEDEAYDHGDEEKNGENGQSSSEHLVEREPKPNNTLQIIKIDNLKDAIKEPHIIEIEKLKTSNSTKRRKRYVDDEVTEKYPYYNDKNVNKDSPLRYAENLENIPLKSQDDMAFYNQATKRIKCQENLPIEDVKDQNKTVGNYTVEIPNEVAKNGSDLGNQIDCFKNKYFGDNPLDSPFFNEPTVEPISEDFFKELRFEQISITTEESVHQDDRLDESSIVHKNSTEASINNLNFNILTDIIGQIKDKTQNETQLETIDAAESTIETEAVDYSHREAKSLTDDRNNSTEIDLPESQALILRRRKYRPVRPYLNKFVDYGKMYPRKTTSSYHPYFEEYVPTSTVLPKYKVVSEVFYKDEIKPNEQLNVFADVINNIQNLSRTDAYSDNAEPIAVKLNVNRYSKVNNKKIKIPSKKIHIKNVLDDSYLDTYDELQSTKYTTTSTTTMKPMVAYKSRPKFKTHRNNEQVYEELLQSLKNKDQYTEESQNQEQFANNAVIHKVKVRRRNRPSTTTTTTTSPTTEVEEEYEDSTKPVLGLNPPGHFNYKTIIANQQTEDKVLNLYIVPGMKPPPKQKVYLYSDYRQLPKNNIRRRYDYSLRRSKREANKPAYNDYSRNRGRQNENIEKTSIDEDDDDDYVPHRPKNYHYDEKLGKIVYHNTKPLDEDEEEEVYEEVVETTRAPKHRTTTKKPLVITSPKPGEGFMDYIKLLQSNPNYKNIMETTTTEKPTTTLKPIKVASSKDAPEFLNLLSKLHSNSGYKKIENEDEAPKKSKISHKKEEEKVEEVEEEEEEDDEEAPAIVQNSPGGQNVQFDSNYQIFDIGDFIPKVKNYMPRTSIDYSKYKTIERPNMRHNLSARYNSEENLEEINTSRLPILAEKSMTVADSSEESTDEVERPSTSTTTTTTTEKSVLKLRMRGRKRPGSRITTKAPSRTSTTRTTTTTTERIQHEKPKRNYLRRRPTRIKLRTTTANILEEDADDTTKILRRRSEQSTVTELTNFQPIYVPDDSREVTDEPEKVAKKEKETANKVPSNVEVFKKYDQTKRHGGNYRRLFDTKNIINQNKLRQGKILHLSKNVSTTTEKPSTRLADIVLKPVAYYTDAKLPKSINQLKAVDVDDVEVDESSTENIDDYYDDEVQIHFDKNEDGTKGDKPNIIKDPSKRLYYYLE
ncbi:uncharacterized protein LOC126266565 [Aethina tumida]|uniref:uncharacterized protein LOC126266565 n=1 Tax=Aethina tumida TaxID=116153 RepID=UPI0021474D4B|nr:uncharacterized protein LOC126266565 [Aethina tumida]